MLEVKPIILLNNLCNFKCCHCYVKKSNKELDLNHLKEFYENTIVPNNVSFLRFAGGEPCLYSKFHELALFLESISSPNIEVNFTTNGSLISDKIISDFKIIKPNMVKVSLLSIKDDKYKDIIGVDYTLKDTMKNIDRLHQDFTVGINMTIMKDTLGEVEDLINYCLSNDIHDLFFSQLTPAGSGYNISDQRLSADDIKKVKSIIASVDKSKLDIRYDDGCSCGFFEDFVLNWDGDVFPCSALVSYPEYKIGRYDSDVATMRNNIKELIKNKTKTCFIEEFVNY